MIFQLNKECTSIGKKKENDLWSIALRSFTTYHLCDFRWVAVNPWGLVSSLVNGDNNCTQSCKELMRYTYKVPCTLPGPYKHPMQRLPGIYPTEGTCQVLKGEPSRTQWRSSPHVTGSDPQREWNLANHSCSTNPSSTFPPQLLRLGMASSSGLETSSRAGILS